MGGWGGSFGSSPENKWAIHQEWNPVYKQLISPVMDWARPIWSFAESTHVGRIHVLLFKCLRLAAGAPWSKCRRQIREDLGVPLIADHIKSLTGSSGSRSADVGNPLAWQLGRCRGLSLVVRRASQARPESSGQSCPPQKFNESCPVLLS